MFPLAGSAESRTLPLVGSSECIRLGLGVGVRPRARLRARLRARPMVRVRPRLRARLIARSYSIGCYAAGILSSS
jgi:hypothetical protein